MKKEAIFGCWEITNWESKLITYDSEGDIFNLKKEDVFEEESFLVWERSSEFTSAFYQELLLKKIIGVNDFSTFIFDFKSEKSGDWFPLEIIYVDDGSILKSAYWQFDGQKGIGFSIWTSPVFTKLNKVTEDELIITEVECLIDSKAYVHKITWKRDEWN